MNYYLSSQKFKSDSYRVGGRHKSSTKDIVGEITFNQKTGKENEMLVGKCVTCDERKSMIVSNDVIRPECLIGLIKNIGKRGLNVSKKMAKNVLKNPLRALEIGANIATAAASRNPKKVLSTLPQVIIFYHKGRGFYFEKFI